MSNVKIPDTKIITINDNEEVRVSITAVLRFTVYDTMSLNDAALKCGGCQSLTIHQLLSISVVDVLDEFPSSDRRIGVCTNCGKISTK